LADGEKQVKKYAKILEKGFANLKLETVCGGISMV